MTRNATAAVDADGVHLGEDDAKIAEERPLIGPDRNIGVSCYSRFELAEGAVAAGADAVAVISAVFDHAEPRDIELAARAIDAVFYAAGQR